MMTRKLLLLPTICVLITACSTDKVSESSSAQETNGQPELSLRVTISTDKAAYQREEEIRVTLVFSNMSPQTIDLCGPFMLRNLGVCGMLIMDGGYWCTSAPAELKIDEHTTAKAFDAPREVEIGPHATRTLTRILRIPHGVKNATVKDKNVIDENSHWAIGKHSLAYSYTCDLTDKTATVLGIKDYSKYWRGNLKTTTITFEVK